VIDGVSPFLNAIKEGAELAAGEIRQLREELVGYRRLLWMIASKHDFIVVDHKERMSVPPDNELVLESYYDPALDGTVVKARRITSERDSK